MHRIGIQNSIWLAISGGVLLYSTNTQDRTQRVASVLTLLP